MARIRTIKPEFWRHEDLSELPEPTHMLAAALLNYADDEGYFKANIGLIRAECSPLREPSVSIGESLKQLEKIGYVALGSGSDGKRYGRIIKFDDHQRINRPTASKIKGLCPVWDGSSTHHGGLTEDSPLERNREQGKEGNREHDASSLRSDSQSLELTGEEMGAGNGTAQPTPPLSATVLAAYHETLPNCQRIAVLNPKRMKRIRAADKLARQVCKQQGWIYALKDFWEAYFDQCQQDPWLRGEVPNPNNPHWKQNLDVLLAEDRFAGIMDQAIASLAETA